MQGHRLSQTPCLGVGSEISILITFIISLGLGTAGTGLGTTGIQMTNINCKKPRMPSSSGSVCIYWLKIYCQLGLELWPLNQINIHQLSVIKGFHHCLSFLRFLSTNWKLRPEVTTPFIPFSVKLFFKLVISLSTAHSSNGNFPCILFSSHCTFRVSPCPTCCFSLTS